MRRFAFSILRRMDPETAHRLTVAALRRGLAGAERTADDPILRTTLFGHDLPNPVGLAAGFDKNAEAADALLRLGFGFVEVGTITPRAQPGNPRPRVFRLPEDEAVINRMGFPSEGLVRVRPRLADRRDNPGVVGVNLGANKDSSDRAGDYVEGVRTLARYASYLTINVSSPNTPGLRAMQTRDALDDLLNRVQSALAEAGLRTPVALKIAPDLDDAELQSVALVALARNVDALIIANTTVARPESLRAAAKAEAGGLSGAPLFRPSTEMLRRMRALTGGRLTLIGAGGVASGADAYEKIRAGAAAVQIYTALALHGIDRLAEIKRDLAAALRKDGFASVAAAVGADA